MVAAKVAGDPAHGMTPIVCVGETLDEREAGETEDEGARPGPRRARPGAPPSRSARWSSPTSRSGRSAPAARRPRTTPRRCARAIRGCVAELSPAPTRRRACASSTADQRQGGEHRRADGPARHRRRAGRRGQPRPRRVRPDRAIRGSLKPCTGRWYTRSGMPGSNFCQFETFLLLPRGSKRCYVHALPVMIGEDVSGFPPQQTTQQVLTA